MSLELWITYAVAATLILIVPGPTIILVISQAAVHGRKSVIPLSAGVILGDLTAMTLSLLGLGAIITTSAALFTLLKWIGAVYLFYMGIKLWKSSPDNFFIQNKIKNSASHSLFRSSLVVTALNPKGIAFFVAFLPQFISYQEPVFIQILILGTTFLLLALFNALLYGLLACQMQKMVKKTYVRKWINRCGGTALIGAGIFTAKMHRSTF